MRPTDGNTDDDSSSRSIGFSGCDTARSKCPRLSRSGRQPALASRAIVNRRLIPALVVALAALAAACQPSPPQPQAAAAEHGEPAVIESDDRQARLRVPEGALPDGVSLQDLRITKLQPEDVPLRFEDEGTVVAYNLEPDGLQLREPASIEIELEPGEGAFTILLWHVWGDQVEPLATRLETDPSGERQYVSAEVSHFSTFVVYLGGTDLWAVELVGLYGPHAVGSAFDVDAQVWYRGPARLAESAFSAEFSIEEAEVVVDGEPLIRPAQDVHAVYWYQQWELDGEFKVRSGPLTPYRIPDKPPRTVQHHRVGLYYGGTFTCVDEDPAVIQYAANVHATYSVLWFVTYRSGPRAGTTVQRDKDPESVLHPLVVAGEFLCQNVPPTPPPPEDPPPPTPEPTPPSALDLSSQTGVLKEGLAEPIPGPVSASEVPHGRLQVFELDGVYFPADGLEVIGAHPPFCHYEHVHGPPITSLLPGADGQPITRSEHLGECGYGPPNFYLIEDPRADQGG